LFNVAVVKSSQAILFQCHEDHPSHRLAYRKLLEGTKGLGEVIVLAHSETGDLPEWIRSVPHFSFSYQSLAALGYTPFTTALVPGSAHFPILQFALGNPRFDFFWLVEYDVRFTGSWNGFFTAFRDDSSDFLSTQIVRYADQPDWNLWEMRQGDAPFSGDGRLRSFNAIFRLSLRAAQFIDQEQKSGWVGHHEATLPTLLNRGGFTITDLGGSGPFTPERYWNKHYTRAQSDPRGPSTTGSVRYRPPYLAPGWVPNRLYHPVKPFRTWWRIHLKQVKLDRASFGRLVYRWFKWLRPYAPVRTRLLIRRVFQRLTGT
jgi:hypothetical protein